MAERIGSVVIEGVYPELDAGRFAVKRVVGDTLEIGADIFKEGHDVLRAVVRWKQVVPQAAASPDWREIPMRHLGNDRWAADLKLEQNGRFVFTVEAWADAVATWASEITRKMDVGRQVQSELLEGSLLFRAAAARAATRSEQDAERLEQAARMLGSGRPEAIHVARDVALLEVAERHPDRSSVVRYHRELEVFVDRKRAEYGSWYEFFPRSASRDLGRHGTFKDCEALLPDIRAMGFDVVYLPPIHPIGKTARKGRNNSLVAGPDDVGSPWAIGSAEGGHKAVHPALGSLDDFRRFVRRANDQGIEVALDLAYQCSPDHPYLRDHPEWFQKRPDGTIKTAENPPKRYEDIVNFDWMGPARAALWAELKSVVLFWVEQGVRTFRVDNPHTKPAAFWQWMIREVQSQHPDVIFLSEAFTRPKVMKHLAKVGFSQSYTYFTWRNFKQELEEYLTELTQSSAAEYMRGNLWPNTPDILPQILQESGPPVFKIRLALAATLSSVYGIYSGYELCESRAVPGTEEYQDSEKYQLVRWDPERAGNIRPFVTTINRIRRDNPALHLYKNLRFYKAHNNQIVFYGKSTPDKRNQLLIAVSLDPYGPQEGLLEMPLRDLGLGADQTYQVHELISDERSLWQGHTTHLRLAPEHPVRIWSVLKFVKSERGFDYYG